MANKNGDGEDAPKAPHRFLGSLKDALMAAARHDTIVVADKQLPAALSEPPQPSPVRLDPAHPPVVDKATVADAETLAAPAHLQPNLAPNAPPHFAAPMPPDAQFANTATRVIRGSDPRKPQVAAARTQLVRGRVDVARGEFHQDPVVGWLVVVGGAGLGAFRPIFEGNNTIGRARTQRIAIDFGDETISGEEQAYIRYDSSDRSFLFVPNLAKTNVVSINNRKPTAAVALQSMDVITMGRTQLAFVPFCGSDFDWSELADAKA
jgi:hypothetical protein